MKLSVLVLLLILAMSLNIKMKHECEPIETEKAIIFYSLNKDFF